MFFDMLSAAKTFFYCLYVFRFHHLWHLNYVKKSFGAFAKFSLLARGCSNCKLDASTLENVFLQSSTVNL